MRIVADFGSRKFHVEQERQPEEAPPLAAEASFRNDGTAAPGGFSEHASHLRAGHRRPGAQKTLVSATDIEEALRALKAPKKDRAKQVGAAVAKKCLEKGIDKVVFDRAGYKYHGRVSALADGAREAGLKF